MDIVLAKELLRSEGYYVIPKEAVRILSTQTVIDRDMLTYSKETTEGLLLSTKHHMLRAISDELLKSGALKLTQASDELSHTLRLAVAVVVPDAAN
jgi:hypothetical protein